MATNPTVRAVLAAAIVAELVGAGVVWAAGAAPQAEIRACIETSTGHLYVPVRAGEPRLPR
ncbi:MAG TPA: hypothetical protein VMN35_03130 [Gaiellaceae bacterium]|nr:hypothetical protein [Gaiellaceae bacterium]